MGHLTFDIRKPAILPLTFRAYNRAIEGITHKYGNMGL